MKIIARGLFIIIGVIGVIGFLGILIASFSSEKPIQIFSYLFLLGVAFLIAGLLLGLLFGIPKSKNADNSNSSILGNNNLEEVSDWLTKIIIGFGIAEISNLDDSVLRLTDILHGMNPDIPKLAILLVSIYFPIYGFISGWLLTRIYITTILAGVNQTLTTIQDKLTTTSNNVIEDNLKFDSNKMDISADLSTEEILDDVNRLEEEEQEINGNTYHKLGIILFSRRNYEVAAKYFKKSYDITQDIKSLINLGVIQNQGFNQPEKAIEIFKQALERDKNSPLALYNLACAQARIGDKEEGMKNLELSLKYGGAEYKRVANKDSALLPFIKLKKFKELLPSFNPRSEQNIGDS